MKITGIRPGEKIHETLISEEEIYHTVKKGKYYAIKSMLPELCGDVVHRREPIMPHEYSSRDAVLDYQGTLALLKKHDLLEVNPKNSDELLR
jgi:UDP-glucose 4-epimerase